MKNLLSIVLCAVAASAFGGDATLGTIGVTAISSRLTNTIVAVSYDDLTGGSGIVISNFVKTTNLTVDDQLAVFSNGKYEVWTLVQPVTEGPKFWQKNETQFFVDGGGQLTFQSGTEASLVSRSVGTGIWLIRQNPTDGNTAVPFYIYGKPSTAMTIKTKPNVWNLVGNPTQGDVPITKEITSGVQDDDQILVPAENGLVTYLYREGKGWRAAADASGKWGAAPTVVAGTGFWIMTKSEVTITWSTAQ